MFEYHGKECPRCQRSLKRAAIIEKRAGHSSTALLLASTMLAIFASTAGKNLRLPFLGLFVATLLRVTETIMRIARETMHLRLEIDKIEEIYAF